MIATRGTESRYASASGVTMFVAAGPLVTMTTPGFPVAVGVARRHVTSALFVAHEHMAKSSFQYRVVNRQDRPSGIPKDHLDSLELEGLEESLSSIHLHVIAPSAVSGVPRHRERIRKTKKPSRLGRLRALDVGRVLHEYNYDDLGEIHEGEYARIAVGTAT